MMKNIILLLFLLFSEILGSQTTFGIKTKKDSLPIENAVFQLPETNTILLTNELGNVVVDSIELSQNQSVLISYLTITDTIIQLEGNLYNNKHIIFYLNEKAVEIDTVTIGNPKYKVQKYGGKKKDAVGIIYREKNSSIGYQLPFNTNSNGELTDLSIYLIKSKGGKKANSKIPFYIRIYSLDKSFRIDKDLLNGDSLFVNKIKGSWAIFDLSTYSIDVQNTNILVTISVPDNQEDAKMNNGGFNENSLGLAFCLNENIPREYYYSDIDQKFIKFDHAVRRVNNQYLNLLIRYSLKVRI